MTVIQYILALQTLVLHRNLTPLEPGSEKIYNPADTATQHHSSVSSALPVVPLVVSPLFLDAIVLVPGVAQSTFPPAPTARPEELSYLVS
jgi:hypothetical protein